MDTCPICLENISTNYCSLEICLTCKKLFCRKCLYPDQLNRLEDCPHCRSKLYHDSKKRIEMAKKILLDKNFAHKGFVQFIISAAYEKEKDFDKALEYLEMSAENNNSCALYHLSNYYKIGIIVNKNINKHKDMFDKAVDKGCLSALYKKALEMELNGDIINSKLIIEKCAIEGLPDAEYRWAFHILNERQSDKFIAINYLERASKKSYTNAILLLADIYYKGLYSITQNINLGIGYYKKAADKESLKASLVLAEFYEKNFNYYNSSHWYKYVYYLMTKDESGFSSKIIDNL